LEFITGHVNGDDPRAVLARHTELAMAASEQFYELPDIPDYTLEDQVLTWTSAVKTPSPENNVASARCSRLVVKERKNRARLFWFCRNGTRSRTAMWRRVAYSTVSA